MPQPADIALRVHEVAEPVLAQPLDHTIARERLRQRRRIVETTGQLPKQNAFDLCPQLVVVEFLGLGLLRAGGRTVAVARRVTAS
ncbi:hypothetical protein GCM10027063_46700 [Promicromonospora xylanilytica]